MARHHQARVVGARGHLAPAVVTTVPADLARAGAHVSVDQRAYVASLEIEQLELNGTGGTGEYTQTFDVFASKPLETNRALRYLWARTRIARLSDFNFQRGNPENKAEITTLGLTYNLLTAYTSFIAVNDVIVNPDGQSEHVNQPLPLPLNVSNLAVGGPVSNVPEPEMSILLIIAALMLAMIVVFKKYGNIRSKKVEYLF